MERLELDPKKFYAEILRTNGITDEIINVEISGPGALTGENFGSICEWVRIQFKNRVKDCHLFVKKSCEISDSHSDPMQVFLLESVMLKECYALTAFLDNLKDFCVRRVG
jgi:hypothetical protein